MAATSATSEACRPVLWGGYGSHWTWTGINGRTATLWDWLHPLSLPLLLPTIVVPALMPVATDGIIVADQSESATSDPRADDQTAADPMSGRALPRVALPTAPSTPDDPLHREGQQPDQ